MNLKIEKYMPLVFWLLLFASALGHPLTVFIISCLLIVFWIFNTHFRINKSLVYLIFPFITLFVFGILEGIQNPLYDFFKDAWYLLKIVVYIAVGFFLMRYLKSFKAMMRMVVLVAVLMSVWHLFKLAIYGGFTSLDIIFELRTEYGISGSLLTVPALICLLFCRRHINLPYSLHMSAIVLCSLSMLLSMSRTYLAAFLLMTLVMIGRRLFRPAGLLAVGALFLVIFVLVDLSSNSPFQYKLGHSIQEMGVQDYSDNAEINENWRGFESFRAMQTFMGGGIVEKIFGQGFGSLIDLGFEMTLGGNQMQMIPITHNGYMYILVKFGLLGFFLHSYFIYKLIHRRSWLAGAGKSEFELVEKLIAGIGWLILFTTFVISGMFNIFQLDSVLIFLGALMYLSKYQNHGYKN